MPETGLELRVGALMLLGLLGLGAFVVLRDANAISNPVPYRVSLARPGALREGAGVRLSGQQIGVVRRIGLRSGKAAPLPLPATERPADGGVAPLIPRPAPSQQPVEITLHVERRHSARLREGTQFFVETAGVLGEAYVEVDPGPPEARPIEPGSLVRGVDPPSIDALMEYTYRALRVGSGFLKDQGPVLDQIISTGGRINRQLEEIDPGLKRTLRIRQNLRQLSADAGTLGLVAARATESGQRLDRLRPALRQLSDKTTQALRRERQRLVHILGEVEAIAGTLDARRREQLREATTRLLETERRRIEKLLADTTRLLDDVKGGKGTLGALANETELFDEMKALSKILKQSPWKLTRPPGAGQKGP